MADSKITPLWPAAFTHALAKGRECPFLTAALLDAVSRADQLHWFSHHDEIVLTRTEITSRVALLAKQHQANVMRQYDGIKVVLGESGYILHLSFSELSHLTHCLQALTEESITNRLIAAHKNPLPHHRQRFYGPLKTKELTGLLRCAIAINSISMTKEGIVNTPVQVPAVEYWAERDPYSVNLEPERHQIIIQWRHKPEMLLAISMPVFISSAELEQVASILRQENKANRFWLAEQIEQQAKRSSAGKHQANSNVIPLTRPRI